MLTLPILVATLALPAPSLRAVSPLWGSRGRGGHGPDAQKERPLSQDGLTRLALRDFR